MFFDLFVVVEIPSLFPPLLKIGTISMKTPCITNPTVTCQKSKHRSTPKTRSTGTIATCPKTMRRREYTNRWGQDFDISLINVQYSAARVNMMQWGKTERPE